MKFVKYLLYLVLLAAIGLVGYTFVGDMSPRQTEIVAPVTIEVN